MVNKENVSQMILDCLEGNPCTIDELSVALIRKKIKLDNPIKDIRDCLGSLRRKRLVESKFDKETKTRHFSII